MMKSSVVFVVLAVFALGSSACGKKDEVAKTGTAAGDNGRAAANGPANTPDGYTLIGGCYTPTDHACTQIAIPSGSIVAADAKARLEKGCTEDGTGKAVASCPSENTLGGCRQTKTSVAPDGTQIKTQISTYIYKGGEATTQDEVKQGCEATHEEFIAP